SAFYVDVFKDIEGINVFVEPNENYYSNNWLSAITIDPQLAGLTREDLRLGLLKDNIESRPLWKPMHLQPVFNRSPYYGNSVSEKLFENGLCLPSGSNLLDSDRELIRNKILQIIKK